jgi:hypothetical protein
LGENGRGSVCWVKRVCEKGQNELLEKGTLGFSTGGGWRVKGVSIGMR